MPVESRDTIGAYLARMQSAEAEHATKSKGQCGVCLREDLPTIPMTDYGAPLTIKGRVVSRVCTACMGDLKDV